MLTIWASPPARSTTHVGHAVARARRAHPARAARGAVARAALHVELGRLIAQARGLEGLRLSTKWQTVYWRADEPGAEFP
jgi:hypothetical protein